MNMATNLLLLVVGFVIGFVLRMVYGHHLRRQPRKNQADLAMKDFDATMRKIVTAPPMPKKDKR